MWACKALLLCLLSLVAIFALGKAWGSTAKGLSGLITKDFIKEFVSPEGRFCLAIGVLFGSIVLLAEYTPNLIGFLARMLDPKSFGEPEGSSGIALWLIFLFFLVNMVMVGVIYWKKNGEEGGSPTR